MESVLGEEREGEKGESNGEWAKWRMRGNCGVKEREKRGDGVPRENSVTLKGED